MEAETRRGQPAQAALRPTAADGLEGLSVARAARRVGLVPSADYRRLANQKDELPAAALDLVRSRLQANAVAACGQTPETLECLHRLHSGQAQMIGDNGGVLRVIFTVELHTSQREPKMHVREIMTAHFRWLDRGHRVRAARWQHPRGCRSNDGLSPVHGAHSAGGDLVAPDCLGVRHYEARRKSVGDLARGRLDERGTFGDQVSPNSRKSEVMA